MGYVPENNNTNSVNKIPYDDIPISRGAPTGNKNRPVYEKSGKRGGRGTNKFLVVAVALMFVLNIALTVLTFGYVKNLVLKNVNYYNYDSINVSDKEVSAKYVEKALWSSVNVRATVPGGISYGAGVVFKIDGRDVYFVTCYHVVEGGTSIKVQLPSQTGYNTDVIMIGYSDRSKYDIAVLKAGNVDTDTLSGLTESAFDGSPEVDVYNSNYLSLGETVFAVGNPLSQGTSITQGIISRLNVIIRDKDMSAHRCLQTDAAINNGNSGGGLFNSYGQYVGMVKSTAKTKNSGNDIVAGDTLVDGFSYVIPSNLVKGVSDRIIYSFKNGGSTVRSLSHLSIGLNLNSGFAVQNSAGVERVELRDQNGEMKSLNKYQVYARTSSSDGKNGDRIDHNDIMISITYTNLDNEEVVIDILNEYFFEDMAYDVMPNTEVKFKVKSGGTEKEIVFDAKFDI